MNIFAILLHAGRILFSFLCSTSHTTTSDFVAISVLCGCGMCLATEPFCDWTFLWLENLHVVTQHMTHTTNKHHKVAAFTSDWYMDAWSLGWIVMVLVGKDPALKTSPQGCFSWPWWSLLALLASCLIVSHKLEGRTIIDPLLNGDPVLLTDGCDELMVVQLCNWVLRSGD